MTLSHEKNQKIARAILFCYLIAQNDEQTSINDTMAVIDLIFNYFDNGMEKC